LNGLHLFLIISGRSIRDRPQTIEMASLLLENDFDGCSFQM